VPVLTRGLSGFIPGEDSGQKDYFPTVENTDVITATYKDEKNLCPSAKPRR
jgi:hypothetical protein